MMKSGATTVSLTRSDIVLGEAVGTRKSSERVLYMIC